VFVFVFVFLFVAPTNSKFRSKKYSCAFYCRVGKVTAPIIANLMCYCSTEADEELARKLQRQFNAEAESPISMTDSTVSDEEYARKLQSLYLKRDMQRVAKKKAATPSGRNLVTFFPSSLMFHKEAKEALDPKKKPEEKPSLWSRLFGGKSKLMCSSLIGYFSKAQLKKDRPRKEMKTPLS